MSDANRVALRYVEETSFGETPTNPALKDLRYTSSSLAYTPKTVVSNEIRADRQVSDLPLVGFEASGNTNHELSFDAFHDLFEGAMFNEWGLKPYIQNSASDTPISATTTNTVTSGAGDDFDVTDFKVNMLVRLSGFGTPSNNKVLRLAQDGATGTLTFAAATLTAEAVPPATARVKAVGFQSTVNDISLTTAPNAMVSAGDIDFTTMDIEPGDWLKLGGTGTNDKFSTAACNDFVRVSTVSADTITFDIVPAGWAASDESASTKVPMVFFGDRLKNGVIEKSYTMELEYQDHTPVNYEYYTGMEVNTWTLTAGSQEIMTHEFAFMGKGASVSPVRATGATTVAAATNDVMNTSNNVGIIREGGSEVSSPNYVMSVKLTLENNLRLQNAVGHVSAIGIGVGRMSLKGELETYFGDLSLLTKLRNNTSTSFDFRVVDGSGARAYLFDMPRVKYESGSPEIQGIDTDIMLNLGFQAILDPTLGYTMKIGRFEYFQ